MFNYFALLSVCTFVSNVFIGLFIFFRDPKNKLNLNYLIYALAVSQWGICEFGYRTAVDMANAMFWIKASYIFWPISVSMFYRIALMYTGGIKVKSINTFMFILAIVPLLIIPIMAYSPSNIFNLYAVKKYWGWTYGDIDQTLHLLSYVWAAIISIYSGIIYIHYYFVSFKKECNKANIYVKKQQALTVAIGLVIPVVLGVSSELVLPAVFRIKVPELTTFGLLLTVLFLGYAIYKFQLFEIKAASVAEDIIDMMSEALFLLDLNYYIQRANKSALKLLRISKENLVTGKNILQYIPNFSVNKDKSEYELITIDSKKVPIILAQSKLYSTAQIEIGRILVASDITFYKEEEKKRIEMQNQMVQTSKMAALGILAAGVGHEINNPLCIAFLNFELVNTIITNDPSTFSKINVNLAKIKESLTRIDKIVNTLRTLVRHDIEDSSHLNVHEVIYNTVDLVSDIYLKEDIVIEKNFNATDYTITGNMSKLNQIILNLLANARDALLDCGKKEPFKIKIETKNEDNKLIIKISDNGSGISKKNMEHIFVPFFTTKAPGKGTGLGLSLCRTSIEEMNGTITIDSIEKQYTAIILSFPCRVTKKTIA